jgi:thiamine biosynthesis lipoprotein ApbE
VRRWRRGGRWLNHLIDPRTGRPADGGVVIASVIAPTTVEAEVLAKAALLLGADKGLRFLEEQNRPGLLALAGGRLSATEAWDERTQGTFADSGKGLTA